MARSLALAAIPSRSAMSVMAWKGTDMDMAALFSAAGGTAPRAAIFGRSDSSDIFPGSGTAPRNHGGRAAAEGADPSAIFTGNGTVPRILGGAASSAAGVWIGVGHSVDGGEIGSCGNLPPESRTAPRIHAGTAEVGPPAAILSGNGRAADSSGCIPIGEYSMG